MYEYHSAFLIGQSFLEHYKDWMCVAMEAAVETVDK